MTPAISLCSPRFPPRLRDSAVKTRASDLSLRPVSAFLSGFLCASLCVLRASALKTPLSELQ